MMLQNHKKQCSVFVVSLKERVRFEEFKTTTTLARVFPCGTIRSIGGQVANDSTAGNGQVWQHGRSDSRRTCQSLSRAARSSLDRPSLGFRRTGSRPQGRQTSGSIEWCKQNLDTLRQRVQGKQRQGRKTQNPARAAAGVRNNSLEVSPCYTPSRDLVKSSSDMTLSSHCLTTQTNGVLEVYHNAKGA
jgi:hypothetical protein